MLSRFIHRPFRLSFLLLVVLVFGFTVPSRPAPQTIKEWDWTEKNWDIVVNDFLPMKVNSGYYVTYRATQSLHASKDEKPEYYFRLGFDLSKKGYGVDRYITVHVRTADSVSIYDQIMNMHRKAPTRSWESIRSAISVKSWDYTEMDCPTVKTEFVEFQNLRYGPPFTDLDLTEIVLDPPVYHFHIEGGHGQSDVTVYDEKHPLVAWAMKTQRDIETCVSEKNKQNPGH
jgi:hypothetical protein